MRVNPNSAPDLLASLQRISADENSVLRQLASGKRVEQPSDDPAGMAALVELQGSDANTQQYLRNVSAVRSRMQVSDSTLSSATVDLQRALTLGVEGANGTLNDADRNSVALEIEGISNHMLDLANSSLAGTYLFAGTASTTKPFTAAADGTIAYKGSDNTNQIQIGEGLWIGGGVSGQGIFGSDGNNVFDSLKGLADAVRNGGDVTTAIATLRSSTDQLSAARVTYGNSMNQLDSAELVMNQRHIQLAQQETDLAGADLATLATHLSSAETSRNALLSVIGKSTAANLFDYLNNG
jgi:flagellar hook-associated protein 3 FlgL